MIIKREHDKYVHKSMKITNVATYIFLIRLIVLF